MFEDILGPRSEEKKPYLGEKSEKEPASVGGVNSPEGMNPNKKPAGISGLKGKPISTPGNIPTPNTPPPIDDDEEEELNLWEGDDDCDCGDDCGCDENTCEDQCVGCLEEDDVWSTYETYDIENSPHIG